MTDPMRQAPHHHPTTHHVLSIPDITDMKGKTAASAHSHGEGSPVKEAHALLLDAMEERRLVLLGGVVVVGQLDEQVALQGYG